MDTEKVQGGVADAAGQVGKAAQVVLDEASVKVSGKAREMREKAQQLYADTSMLTRERTADSPFAALGVAALVGFLIGVIWSSGRNDSTDANAPGDYRRPRRPRY
ncbi:hypothetical protein B0G84_8517 [Paraburkholderia sp. BL8N3]|nr:CsbD family protein [Paraburkholderia sp. BL8N3]TCK32678.1 hypothetical protein B0G84_8517 [Paraburkholderia sp. BL8N3]